MPTPLDWIGLAFSFGCFVGLVVMGIRYRRETKRRDS